QGEIALAAVGVTFLCLEGGTDRSEGAPLAGFRIHGIPRVAVPGGEHPHLAEPASQLTLAVCILPVLVNSPGKWLKDILLEKQWRLANLRESFCRLLPVESGRVEGLPGQAGADCDREEDVGEIAQGHTDRDRQRQGAAGKAGGPELAWWQ